MNVIINFRDFGGYPAEGGRRLKKGWLYRSGTVNKAGRRDPAMLQSLGIKTLVDLRSARERKREVRLWPGARLISLPMAFDELTRERLMPLLFKRGAEGAIIDMIEGVYRETVDRSCPQLTELFRLLALPEVYPVLIFCRAGRDRTGFVSAVIQLALGVGAEDVVADYLRSNAYFLPQARRALAVLRVVSLGLSPTQNLRVVFTSQERYIRSVMGRIEEKYGGIQAYLERCGVSAQAVEALKELLLW